MGNGVLDGFLTAPISRGTLTAAMLAYQAVTTIVQSAIVNRHRGHGVRGHQSVPHYQRSM
jgi:hypothetical protein